jgi:tight adherence protein C
MLACGILGCAGVYIFFLSLERKRRASPEQVLEKRLRSYETRLHPIDAMELEKPFAERVLQPAIESARERLSRMTPESTQDSIRAKLELAGRPGRLEPGDFMLLRYFACVALFMAGLLLGVLLSGPFLALAPMGGAVGGYFLPVLWLDSKTKDRRKKIAKALPDALDLLTVSVEAGLGLDAAIDQVVKKTTSALAEEFGQFLQEVRLGRGRFESLQAIADRCGIEELHNFVQAVIQSETMGVGIAKIMRIQADEFRRKRRQLAQEKAAQASLKMLLPMIGCIFPTLWIVLLGPSILILMHARG